MLGRLLEPLLFTLLLAGTLFVEPLFTPLFAGTLFVEPLFTPLVAGTLFVEPLFTPLVAGTLFVEPLFAAVLFVALLLDAEARLSKREAKELFAVVREEYKLLFTGVFSSSPYPAGRSPLPVLCPEFVGPMFVLCPV